MNNDKMPSSAQTLKDRVAACKVYEIEQTGAKGYIPGLRAKLLALYPEYNTAIGDARVRNVLQLRSSDLKLTSAIEQLTTSYIEGNKTTNSKASKSAVKSNAGIAVPAL